MADDIRPLMQVSSPEEGDEVCGWLREVDIKCNHHFGPDQNSLGAVYGQSRDVIQVFVRDSDLAKAREVVLEHQKLKVSSLADYRDKLDQR